MAFGSLRQQESNEYNKKTSDLEVQALLGGSKGEILTQQRQKEILNNLTGAEKISDFFPVEEDGLTLSNEGLTQVPPANPMSIKETEAAIINMKDGYFIQDPRVAQAA